ncbi:HDOD domain-containing protein [uncultured Pseudoteredinibacter sp.]|uniref:HDOD domain-containing protein n=1 Tax=uncultured Pseudoteredinibacter sp. TaxID=1641701 RepID=UPI0026277775|nr:HDOD domain-containing protein [uncultured Pseudoteredinibacter sp.]
MNPLAAQARTDILSAIDNDELVLPSLPEIALQVREVAEDPDAGVMDLNKVIGNDVALTARIIKVANSPTMRGAQEITNLQMALSRLGLQFTASLAMGLAMEQMFQAKSKEIDRRIREVWSRSSEIAGMCNVLCKFRTDLQPDQATLAGLVHNIGTLPIFKYAEENPESLNNPFVLDMLIYDLGAELGDKILSTWEFSPELVHVPSQHLDFNREGDEVSYADIVTVAMLQNYMGGNHPFANTDYATVTAFKRLGLDPNMEDAEGEDISAEMEAAMSMLA